MHQHAHPAPTITISPREARRTQRRLDELLTPAPGDPFDWVDCLALGAWRRLASGERGFPPAMWKIIRALAAAENRTEQWRAAAPVRQLSDAEAVEVFRKMMCLHVSLATGGGTYGAAETDAKALLAAAGIIAALEMGATRFGGSVIDFLEQDVD